MIKNFKDLYESSPDSGINPRILRRWMPIFINFEKNTIGWLNTYEISFREPFFYETIEVLFSKEKDTQVIVSNIEILKDVVDLSKEIIPDLFIFQISKCGSTLLKNMFSALPQNYVISEHPIIGQVLQAPIERFSYNERIELLRNVINSVGQAHIDGQENYIMKFGSHITLALPLIKKTFPKTPWIFLYRDPIEVIVSNIYGPSGYFRNRYNKNIQKLLLNYGFSTQDFFKLESAEYCAKVIGVFLRIAEKEINENCIIVNYNQISEPFFRKLLSFLQMKVSEVEFAAMCNELNFYSKDSSKKKKFSDDRKQKKNKAGNEIYEYVKKWTKEIYEKLDENAKVFL